VPPNAEILLDTSVVLAYLNAGAAVSPAATVVIDDFVRTGRNRATISVVSVVQTLVRPIDAGPAALGIVDAFLLHFPNLTVSSIDYAIAREAARLRAQASLKTPDALIIATALGAGIPIVIANDAKWASAIADAAPTVTLCHLDAHVPLWIGEGPLGQGRVKMSCVPMRRQTMWASPSRTVDPCSKVARPSSAHVISNTPAAPWTRLTRRPGRKPPDSRSTTNFAAAARKAAFCALVKLAKSRRNRSVCAKVGMSAGQSWSESRKAAVDPEFVIRPALMSAEASRSPSCQSCVQNQAWEASISFFGRSRIPSAVISISTGSPASRWAASRMSRGMVTWPFARMTETGMACSSPAI